MVKRKPSTDASNPRRLPGWIARRGVAEAAAMLARSAALIDQCRVASGGALAEPWSELEVVVDLAADLCEAALEGRDINRDVRGQLYAYLNAQGRADDYWKMPGEGSED